MHDFGFAFEPADLPRAADSERAALRLERWHEAVGRTGDPGLATFARDLAAGANGRAFLEAVLGNSPYLAQCAARDPALVRRLLTTGPDAAFAAIMQDLDRARHEARDRARLAASLRHAKRQAALTVAAADIAGAWPLERVTGTLSDFAEAALGCASALVLGEAQAAGAFSLPYPDEPERDSGLVVIGMGKLGARELNFSSDIDLIVLYEHERIASRDPEALPKHFVRLTRNLTRLMDERTADGYVFRTDLRLRPDPGSTPLAISVLAAETYYESFGQNWERAAMIKARPVAGDRGAGSDFLARLKPFVWRRNLDFAAIQDIHSIKRQIHAHRGGDTIAVLGHDVKLGRGGIREIEFFVQTQQLIWGGRRPELRCRATLDSLAALRRARLIDGQTADEMAAAYRFLRRVEHRLQMIDDEQTHRLPQDRESLDRLAVFLGHADGAAFTEALLGHLRRVEAHYAALFEDAPPLAAPDIGGNLVFTGAAADPETIRTLERLGFANPGTVDGAVRAWHRGRYRAVRSARGRELLTELIPALLAALAKTPAPDDAFVKFDQFLSRLPAGVQLFSMFHSNLHLLDLVAEIVGAAPRLAEHLSRRPSALDAVLSADFFEPPPPPADLEEELSRHLAAAAAVEDVLDAARRWANDRKFQVGVQSLRGLIAPRAAAAALGNIADAALACLRGRIEAEFARHHGRIEGGGMAVVAMGRLGGHEMTPASDLDLIFVYSAADDAVASDGARPLPVAQYFARLSQRLLNALTAQTNEGRLYEVDMRLRPSGNAGPLASSLEAFERYHENAAWTWEHMALTRARVVAGPAALGRRITGLIRGVLTSERDADALLGDVADMRARMDAEHHTDLIWEVKHLRGGLVDIDFIAQYLQLKHARDHPGILSPNTRTALKNLQGAGFLTAGIADRLIEALELWQGLQGLLRLTVDGDIRGQAGGRIPDGLHECLARIGGDADFAALEDRMRTLAATIHGHFRDLLETPAAALPAPRDGQRARR